MGLGREIERERERDLAVVNLRELSYMTNLKCAYDGSEVDMY